MEFDEFETTAITMMKRKKEKKTEKKNCFLWHMTRLCSLSLSLFAIYTIYSILNQMRMWRTKFLSLCKMVSRILSHVCTESILLWPTAIHLNYDLLLNNNIKSIPIARRVVWKPHNRLRADVHIINVEVQFQITLFYNK